MARTRRPKNSGGKSPAGPKPSSGLARAMEHFSLKATAFAGSSWAFAMALAVIVIWVVTGPLFGFSDTWQLVINTGTTIVTFLMVFLIQRAQNKDSRALQLKLNEIVAAIEGASNRLIDVESLSESEIEVLHQHYGELAKLSGEDADVRQSHSIEEAGHRHDEKSHRGRPPHRK